MGTTKNNKSKAFKSENYIFRPTGLGLALVAAGIAKPCPMVREPKKELIGRQFTDRDNRLPSVKIALEA